MPQSQPELKTIQVIAHKVAFLMQHQYVSPEIKILIEEINHNLEGQTINSEYLTGAHDVLCALFLFLEGKGSD